MTQAQQSTQSGATHEESRPEDPKDMRSTEAGYLARGLAARVEDLREARGWLRSLQPTRLGPDDRIVAPALVGIEDDDGDESVYLLVPTDGADRLDYDGTPIQTISPVSPLGQELVGRFLGDDFEYETPRGPRSVTIVWMQ